jgi:hypothetical protein
MCYKQRSVTEQLGPPSVAALVRSHGADRSSVIAHLLTETFDINNAYARKLIERSAPHVRRLRGVRFARNEQFLYLDEQHQQEPFWHSLVRAFDDCQSVFGFAVNSLMAHDGIVPRRHFGILSGSPFRLTRHLSHEVVLQRLLELGLFEMTYHANCGDCITFGRRTPFGPADPKLLRARMAAERVLLGAVQQWMRNLGLGSYNKVELRSDATGSQPRFGQFDWDVTAPSLCASLRILKRFRWA